MSAVRPLRSCGWALGFTILLLTNVARAADQKVELLWPNGAPGAIGTEETDKPTITLWPAPAETANGCAVVVYPGGGYRVLANDHEGVQIARWLNSLGVSAFVVKYRLTPRYKHPAPLQDAQRAVRMVRSRAKEWNVDPTRIGIIGFSAGGHLSSTVVTHFDAGKADSSDPIEKASSRPDFAIICYPVISLVADFRHQGLTDSLIGKDANPELAKSLSSELQVKPDTPPVFLFQTTEDPTVLAEHPVAFYLALKKAKVPVEMHIYEKGRHGVGLAQGDPVLSTWPGLCVAWMKSHGWIRDAKIVASAPNEAIDPDFAVQGEYAGEIQTGEGARKAGVQIYALGKGKFHAAGYLGGLPGAGGDQHETHHFDGSAKGAEIVFPGENVSLVIRGGSLVVESGEGHEIGKLPRVERKSPTLGLKAPEGAVVLFDGSSAGAFEGGKMTADGLLMPGATSKQKFQSGTLHLEFRTPYQPQDSGQARGNSGCYLQGRYEVQILDSFGLEGKNNECGGIYEVRAPDVNLCYPPLAWQTYDIDFTAAKYDASGALQKPARITVRHNGVVIHNDIELPNRETRAAPVKPGAEPGPVYLQDHGNPVRFRNVWFQEKS